MPWNHEPGTGQAQLSDAEKDNLVIGNQHTEGLTNIQWQVVKAAALRHRVPDWTSRADSALTMEENCEIMRKNGTGSDGPTMKELKAKLK